MPCRRSSTQIHDHDGCRLLSAEKQLSASPVTLSRRCRRRSLQNRSLLESKLPGCHALRCQILTASTPQIASPCFRSSEARSLITPQDDG